MEQTQTKNSPVWLFVVYNLCFLVLAIASICLFKERIYGADASSYLFEVINQAGFYTERGRFIIWLSQLLPVSMVWLGLPLKQILIGHSLGHVIFFYLIFLIAHCFFKNPYVGLLLIMNQTLATREAYFAWPYGEVYYGNALVILIATVLLSHRGSALLQLFVISIAAFLLLTGHPLVLPSLLLLVVLSYWQSGASYRLIFLCLICGVMALVRFVFLTSYDGSLAKDGLDALTFSIPVEHVLGLFSAYPFTWISLGGAVILLTIKKSWWPVLTILTACIAVGLMISAFLPLNSATQQYYQAFAGITMVAVFFTLSVYSGPESKQALGRAFIGLLLILCGCSFSKILLSKSYYTAHVLKLERLSEHCQSLDGNRFIIMSENLYKDPSLTWVSSVPYHELLLLSANQGYPVSLWVFERAMEAMSWQKAGIVPLEGPSDPREKSLVFANTPGNRDSVKRWLSNRKPTFNEDYFPTSQKDNEYMFLNTLQSPSGPAPKVHLELDVDNLYKGKILSIGIHVSGPPPVYSGDQFRVNLAGCNGLGVNPFPLTTDVMSRTVETIWVPEDACASQVSVQLIYRDSVIAQEQLLLN